MVINYYEEHSTSEIVCLVCTGVFSEDFAGTAKLITLFFFVHVGINNKCTFLYLTRVFKSHRINLIRYSYKSESNVLLDISEKKVKIHNQYYDLVLLYDQSQTKSSFR